jgi:hypothetical protein
MCMYMRECVAVNHIPHSRDCKQGLSVTFQGVVKCLEGNRRLRKLAYEGMSESVSVCDQNYQRIHCVPLAVLFKYTHTHTHRSRRRPRPPVVTLLTGRSKAGVVYCVCECACNIIQSIVYPKLHGLQGRFGPFTQNRAYFDNGEIQSCLVQMGCMCRICACILLYACIPTFYLSFTHTHTHTQADILHAVSTSEGCSLLALLEREGVVKVCPLHEQNTKPAPGQSSVGELHTTTRKAVLSDIVRGNRVSHALDRLSSYFGCVLCVLCGEHS